MVDLKIDHQEIERRKQLRRDLWDYKPVDHIPITLWLMPYCSSRIDPGGPYTFREMFDDPEAHFQINVARIEKSLRLLPDDYIPFARLVLGYMTTATLFGVGVHWGDDPNQPPGAANHIIHDMEEVYQLERPTLDQGLIPELLRRLRYHREHLPPDVYLTGINAGGPLQLCTNLVETNLMYTSFYEHPQALHHLLELATAVVHEVQVAVIEAAGGTERMTCIDWDPNWAPEAYKGHLCDDVCSMISPRTFEEFGLPYNNRMFAPWGPGMLHNCGPHPAKHLYLAHEPTPKGINCAYRYTKDELAEIGELFAGRAQIEVSFDSGETPEEMIEGFRFMMETLAPDTVGVPLCLIDGSWSDEEITAFYWEMRKIGEEYAAHMRWTGAEG